MAYGSEWRERGGLITPLARATRGRGLPSLDARSQGVNQAILEGKVEEPTSLSPSRFAKLRLLRHDGAS